MQAKKILSFTYVLLITGFPKELQSSLQGKFGGIVLSVWFICCIGTIAASSWEVYVGHSSVDMAVVVPELFCAASATTTTRPAPCCYCTGSQGPESVLRGWFLSEWAKFEKLTKPNHKALSNCCQHPHFQFLILRDWKAITQLNKWSLQMDSAFEN